MRVIARGTLTDFVANKIPANARLSAKGHFDAWFAEAEKATWQTPAEVKQQYRSASVVGQRVVFNIKGNHFRLIVKINYAKQILFVVWIGNHQEYDQTDVATVEYDKQRYK